MEGYFSGSSLIERLEGSLKLSALIERLESYWIERFEGSLTLSSSTGTDLIDL